ncbi:hypothetical protein ABK040_005144 [Willaertia magna]
MTKTVFVSNLDFKVKWFDLKDHFRPAGNIARAEIFTKNGGMSIGSGKVTFEDEQSAQNAVDMFNGTNFSGRTITVKLDVNDFQGRQVFVSNLSFKTNSQSLREAFSQFGELEKCFVVKDDNGYSRGNGIVRYVNGADAAKAIESMNGTNLDNRTIYVKLDEKI